MALSILITGKARPVETSWIGAVKASISAMVEGGRASDYSGSFGTADEVDG